MSDKNGDFNFFDPTGMVKSMRNAGMDAWAKMMIEVVNSDAYAQAQGEMLDTWLASSAPFRKAMESSITQTLANLNLPSRDDITRLAERLTNIEMKLDDMDARLTELSSSAKVAPRKRTKSSDEEAKK